MSAEERLTIFKELALKEKLAALKDCLLYTSFIAEGEELMGYCALNPVLEIEEDCAEERDAIFYKALIPESDIILSQGMYAVIYPHDVHRPCCFLEQPQRVKKIVIKVSIDTLEK